MRWNMPKTETEPRIRRSVNLSDKSEVTIAQRELGHGVADEYLEICPICPFLFQIYQKYAEKPPYGLPASQFFSDRSLVPSLI